MWEILIVSIITCTWSDEGQFSMRAASWSRPSRRRPCQCSNSNTSSNHGTQHLLSGNGKQCRCFLLSRKISARSPYWHTWIFHLLTAIWTLKIIIAPYHRCLLSLQAGSLHLFALFLFLKLFLLLLLSVEIDSCFELSDPLFLQGIWSILNSAWLPKFSVLLFITVRADAATNQLLKLCPLVGDCLAAWPTLLEVMEDRLSWVETATGTVIFTLFVIFVAPRSNRDKFELFHTFCTSCLLLPWWEFYKFKF